MTSDARYVIPNGPLIAACRKGRGWSREELEWQSHLVVERAALDKACDVRFRRRYQKKGGTGLAGLPTSTITNIENSKRVNTLTLSIVAETFGVPVNKLIHPDDASFVASSPQADADKTPDAYRRSILDTAINPAHLSDREKAEAVRQLLDALYPPLPATTATKIPD